MSKKKTGDTSIPAPPGRNEEGGDRPAPATLRYTRAALLGAERYQANRDLLSVLLEDGKEYSHREVGTMLERFLKRPV